MEELEALLASIRKLVIGGEAAAEDEAIPMEEDDLTSSQPGTFYGFIAIIINFLLLLLF